MPPLPASAGPPRLPVAAATRHPVRRRLWLLRPDTEDLRIVGHNVGWVLIGVGLLMLAPAALGLALAEYDQALGFVIGGAIAGLAGLPLIRLGFRREVAWTHGMVIAGLGWVVAPLFGAVPLFLSGHFGSFLDAYFDAMSGFATAGLTVINDLDHLADSVNLWRHLMQYVGGQGLVVVVLGIFAAGGGAVSMYVGEAREERILPSVISTARFIVRVSVMWLLIATPVLWLAMVIAGFNPGRALFHAVNMFMAGFSTGGFAPMTASAAFYHSPLVEAVLSVLMLAGATSFALHAILWNRRYADVRRHIEARAFAACFLAFFALTAVSLARSGAYDSAAMLFRRGAFTILSSQTTTGFAVLPSRTLVTHWGALAPAVMVASMAIGAMSGSTGGGIKAIRVALVAKSIKQDIARILLPPDALMVEHYHAGQPRILRPDVVRSAALVLLMFLVLYGLGGAVGMFYGYPFEQAFFESVSAAGTVGLSVGLTGPTLETGLKLTYIIQIWMGRLELIAVLALFGFAYSAVRGRV